ncbi:hypothetical protein CEP53_007920 [Fusarium sp. AF-6]|nr:hypothetical protein CEP53_007920 [Fusarium sp. AF-6]
MVPQRDDDIAPAAKVSEVVSYYNAVISPDVSLEPHSGLSMSSWLMLPHLHRHLYFCMVSGHKSIRTLLSSFTYVDLAEQLPSKSSPELAVLFHHQTCAIHMLQRCVAELSRSQTGPDTDLFEGIVWFICLCIQQSAYRSWASHLQGAKALLRFWGRRTLHDTCGFPYYAFMMIDIYRATTSPATSITDDTIKQHELYLQHIDVINVDARHTLTPVPSQILVAAVATTIRRLLLTALEESQPSAGACSLQPLRDIIRLAKTFCPRSWSENVLQLDNPTPAQPGRESETTTPLDDWIALSQCYQSATILYAVLSDKSCYAQYGMNGHYYDKERLEASETLMRAIRYLFQRRKCSFERPGHYKMIIWPMVVAGVEIASVGNATEDLQFLCASLGNLAMELGALAMHHAAVFLQNLWEARNGNRGSNEADKSLVDWDWIFRENPIFLM